jgi:hypothetical protein
MKRMNYLPIPLPIPKRQLRQKIIITKDRTFAK